MVSSPAQSVSTVACVEITRLGPDDVDRLVRASPLFDESITRRWASSFLSRDGHHVLLASIDGVDVGFVSGVETTHPDKGTEMFLYELGVAEEHQHQGVGHALVDELRTLGIERGCYGMWVLTDDGNPAALRAYAAAGGKREPVAVMFSWTF
jgi:ribosomal protein S18 acetylase RimI-like enzyme